MTVLPIILAIVAQVAGPGQGWERVVLTGGVVGPDGKPAAGAEVVLTDDAATPNPTLRLAGAAVRQSRRALADGRFQIELPERGQYRFDLRRRLLFLWAFRPGGSLALRPIPEAWPADGEPIRLALAPARSAAFLILDPDDQPVAGARITPAVIRGMNLPVELGDRFAARADAAGRATLTLSADDELDLIRVTSDRWGVQQLRVPRPDEAGVHTIHLTPVGRIIGRVEAGDPQAVRGLAIRLRTTTDPAAAGDAGGFAAAVTDDQGRFTVPVIAAGNLILSVENRADLPWRWQPPGPREIPPGGPTDVTIPLQRAGLVRGIVQEVPSGRPVSDVGMGVARGLDPRIPLVRSDAGGRFSTYVAPGPFLALAVDLPRGYHRVGFGIPRQVLPEGTAELNLPPIEVRRGVELTGRVLDAAGRPVASAVVSGRLELGNGRYGGMLGAVTDGQGRYRITGVPADVKVRLSASRGQATTALPEPIPANKGTMDLTILPANALALFGRVRDPAGQPVAGAAVRVSSGFRLPAGIVAEQGAVAFDDDGHTVLRTGADGQFRTPKQLRPDLEYHVDVEAEGYVPAGAAWIQPGDKKLWNVGALTLQPAVTTRVVAGRVVDSAGRPIAGVTVFQSGDGPTRTRATTDSDGRFRLPGIYREPAFLLVSGEGLAIEGHRIGAGSDPVELKARRVGEPYTGPPLRTLPPFLPREEEKALARRMIGTDLTLLTGETNRDSYALAHTLARVDLERALDLVENATFRNPYCKEALQLECANALRATSFKDAAAIAETFDDPSLRAYFYFQASDLVPRADRARKLELIDKALRHARRPEVQDANRLSNLGRIGVRLLMLGETERGTELLREGQRLVNAMRVPAAGAGGARPLLFGADFATKLARIDVPAALALTEGIKEPEATYYRGGVALALADRDPAQAERLLAGLQDKQDRIGKIIRSAGRMAAVDRERAHRLVAMLDRPSDQALALGAMAQTLAETDRPAAKTVLTAAFRRLEASPPDQANVRITQACVVAGHLLPTAEALDSDLLRHGFWLAVSLRPPRPAGGSPQGWYEQTNSNLAITLARYDRAVARQVLEPAAARARVLVERNAAYRGHHLFVAATLIDPAWAVSLADALPDDPPGRPVQPKANIRRVIAEALADEGNERRVYLDENYLGFIVDSVDREW